MKSHLVASALFTLALSPAALAAGDMLQPNEIPTTGISANPANDSGMFVGGGLAFGQSRTTEGDGSPGLGYLLKLEPGYQLSTGSWSRVELSAELLTGKFNFRDDEKVEMPVKLGFLAKVGYGYSLGNKLFGIARIGFGPVLASLESEIGGVKVESDGDLSGIAALFAYDFVVPAGESLDFVGGIGILHTQFDLDKVKDGSGNKQSVDKNVIVNMPHAQVGLRLRL